jgi:hypothetical protein
MADPPPSIDPHDPLAAARGLGLDGLLALLERLDGAEEAAVARAALAGQVPAMLVVEEVQREVERRLLRSARFYDESEW